MKQAFYCILAASLLSGCASNGAVVASDVATDVGAPSLSEEVQCLDRAGKLEFPNYPVRSLQRGTKGWVVLSFELASDGGVSGVAVSSEHPAGEFSAAALDALARSTFQPGTGTRSCKARYMFRPG